MLAKRVPTILPPLAFEEAMETMNIHRVAGVLGGGIIPQPREVSLVHNGVLFLNQLPEFPRNVLEVMRPLLADGTVTIVRRHVAQLSGTIHAPALHLEDLRTAARSHRYSHRCSGGELSRAAEHGSGKLRRRQKTNSARAQDPARSFRPGAKRRTYANAQMGSREIRKNCDLGTEASTRWSARSPNRV